MKKILSVSMALAFAFVCGCRTDAGMSYIGPIGYYHAKSCDKALMTRSQFIPEAKKPAVFKAVAMGSSPNEIAVGVGVDVGNLISGDYTTSEVAMQLLSSLGDSLIYGAAGYAGYAGYKAVGGSGETRNTTVYIINGDNNNINGAGNQSNNSASNGGANGDMAVGQ